MTLTLTFELALIVSRWTCVKGQRSFSSKVIIRIHRQTDTSDRLFCLEH